MDEFAAYLHNPYAYLTQIQKDSMLKFTTDKNCNIEKELLHIVSFYFNNINSLHQRGLKYHFELLKNHVENSKLIGLILYGANIENLSDNTLINKYHTQDKKVINITVNSVCINLLNEYIKSENIDKLCKESVSNMRS